MANIPIETITKNNDGNTYVIKDANAIPKTGGAVMTGTNLGRYDDTSSFSLWGGSDHSGGAKIDLYGKDHSTYSGCAFIRTIDANNNVYQMTLKPDGTLTWGSKNIAMQEDTVPRSGGAVIGGKRLSRTVDDDQLNIDGGSGGDGGGSIALYGKDINYFNRGGCTIVTRVTSTYYMNIFSDGSWTWQGQAVQLVSDQRFKQQISQIDDDLLTAWEDVELVQFKYNDAVEQKRNTARLHTGYVVQQIDDACKKHNVDISAYGLYCHEEYEEETREVENADGTKETKVIRPASEHYSLRYTEALIVECAYLRKCIKELKEEIKELKNKD